MSEQVEKTGFGQLREEARSLGVDLRMNEENMQKAVDAKKAANQVKGPTGMSAEDVKNIGARMRVEEETRVKIREERELVTERARIIAESESMDIPVTIPENPTLLDLARARKTLGLKKKEVRESPETVAIEASKRGYYVFNNREQDDASHTANLGGKYIIHLIANQIHVLSDYHVKKWKQIAVTPEYGRVSTGVNPETSGPGNIAEECRLIGSKPRWLFERLGDAPQDAPFGLVTDAKILKELTAAV